MAPLTPQSPMGTFSRVYDSVPPPNMTTRHGLLSQNHSGQALPIPEPTYRTTMCLRPLRLVQALEDSRLRIDTSRRGSDPLPYTAPCGTAPLRALRLVQALETRSKDSTDILSRVNDPPSNDYLSSRLVPSVICCNPIAPSPPWVSNTPTLVESSTIAPMECQLSKVVHPAPLGNVHLTPTSIPNQNSMVQRVTDPILPSSTDPDYGTPTCLSPSNTASGSSWSIEYPRALKAASESFAVPPHTFPQSYSCNMTNLYPTTSSTLMDSIENSKVSSPHPDAMHPPCPNRATLLPENLQEDKSALTVEERMAPIWAKHQVKEKRRIQLVARAREIVTDFVQSTGKSGVVTAEIYDDIVVATTTNMVKTYLERRAVK